MDFSNKTGSCKFSSKNNLTFDELYINKRNNINLWWSDGLVSLFPENICGIPLMAKIWGQILLNYRFYRHISNVNIYIEYLNFSVWFSIWTDIFAVWIQLGWMQSAQKHIYFNHFFKWCNALWKISRISRKMQLIKAVYNFIRPCK